jgi:hypothetical protein
MLENIFKLGMLIKKGGLVHQIRHVIPALGSLRRKDSEF